jgi:hypothetical protein
VYCPTSSVFHKIEVPPPQNHQDPYQTGTVQSLALITTLINGYSKNGYMHH